MRQTARAHSESGFGVEFEWDTQLLSGYNYAFGNNVAKNPSTAQRNGIRLSGHEPILDKLRPDVLLVLGWSPASYLQVIRWGKRRAVPLVCRGESNLLSARTVSKRMAKQIYFRWLFRQFSAFAVIGKLNRDLYRHYGVPKAKLFNAPYSIDTFFFQQEFQKHRGDVRRPGRWRIGFAGKLIPKKRPLDLIGAASKSAYKDHLEIVIIGDGPLQEELRELAFLKGVAVQFRGFLNQSEIVRRGYADLDAIVLPSNELETWGLVINEAMTGGIPAIVSDLVGCAPDLVIPGKAGYIFRSGDVVDLASCIDRLVGQLQAGRDFGKAVKEHIQHYSLDESARGIEAALKSAAE